MFLSFLIPLHKNLDAGIACFKAKSVPPPATIAPVTSEVNLKKPDSVSDKAPAAKPAPPAAAVSIARVLTGRVLASARVAAITLSTAVAARGPNFFLA